MENHGNVTILWRHVIDDTAPDLDLARRNRLQPGNHAQERGLAAAGRADKHDKFAVINVDIDAVHDLHCAIALGDAANLNICHAILLLR